MAVVHLQADHRCFTGGARVVDIDAKTVGDVIDELDRRHPGLGRVLTEGASVAINGELIANGIYEAVDETTEIYFIAPISGG